MNFFGFSSAENLLTDVAYSGVDYLSSKTLHGSAIFGAISTNMENEVHKHFGEYSTILFNLPGKLTSNMGCFPEKDFQL